MENKKFIPLKELEVYQLARELSKIGWEIYSSFDWQTKKTMGDQFITATDSVGANVAEGYGRYHYLDKIKFFYNARASLSECSDYWMELIFERKKVSEEQYALYKTISKNLSVKLNNFITSTYQSKTNAS